MTSTYHGYTIFHDRTGAQAWKCGFDPSRKADIIAHDLAAVIEHITVLEANEPPEVSVPV